MMAGARPFAAGVTSVAGTLRFSPGYWSSRTAACAGSASATTNHTRDRMARSLARSLAEEAEVRAGIAADVGQHRRQVSGGHAEPGGQRGGVLIDRRRRNPTPFVGEIVRAGKLQRRERP